MYSSSASYSSPSSPSRYSRSSSAREPSIGTSTLSGSRYSSSGLLSGRSNDIGEVTSSYRRAGSGYTSNGYDRSGIGGSSKYGYESYNA